MMSTSAVAVLESAGIFACEPDAVRREFAQAMQHKFEKKQTDSPLYSRGCQG